MAEPVRLLLTQNEAAQILGVGRDYLRKLVAGGELGIVRVGSDERVPYAELEEWVRRNTEYSRWLSGGDRTEVGSSTSLARTGSASARPLPPTPHDAQSWIWNEPSRRRPRRSTGEPSALPS